MLQGNAILGTKRVSKTSKNIKMSCDFNTAFFFVIFIFLNNLKRAKRWVLSGFIQKIRLKIVKCGVQSIRLEDV